MCERNVLSGPPEDRISDIYLLASEGCKHCNCWKCLAVSPDKRRLACAGRSLTCPCFLGDAKRRETRLKLSLGFLRKSRLVWSSPMLGPALCMSVHTASSILLIYSPLRHPNQSSVAGSFVLEIHCRDCSRSAIWQLLLPL